MKKRNLFGWLAMASMVLGTTGCSNDEVVNDYSAENAIQFGTYVGRDASSRAGVITTESLKTDTRGFGVFAYYTGQADYTSGSAFTPNFMKNEQVTWSSTENKWTYDPVKYWPNNENDKISFIAYAPWQANFDLNNTGIGKYTLTVPNEVTQQHDLLWSKSANFNVKKQDIEGTVNFVFGHALSKIGFTINAGIDLVTEGGQLDGATTIYVDKVELASLNNVGTLDMSKTTAGWTDKSGSATYVWDYKKDATTNELTNNILTSTTDFGEGKEKTLINDNAYLMTIPQNPGTITLTVTYRVFTKDDNLEIPKDGNTLLVPEQPNDKGSLITNVIPVTIENQEFKANTQYTYNIILGMTSVKVSAEVAEWEKEQVSVDEWFNENTKK